MGRFKIDSYMRLIWVSLCFPVTLRKERSTKEKTILKRFHYVFLSHKEKEIN